MLSYSQKNGGIADRIDDHEIDDKSGDETFQLDGFPDGLNGGTCARNMKAVIK